MKGKILNRLAQCVRPATARSEGKHGNNAFPKRREPDLRKYLKLWAAAVTFLALAQLGATFILSPSFLLTSIADIISFLLVLSVLLVFSVNVSASPRQTQLFWVLLVTCWGARVVGQALWLYFDLVLRRELPNPFIGDILSFLSNVPVLAALLLQPNVHPVESRKSRSTVDFLLLLLWWLYLYVFLVIPWQYVVLDGARYGSGYDRLNSLLDVVLLLTLGFLWSHNRGRWKWFYASFFGAQSLITVSGYLANQAIDKHLYYAGSWYDFPYALALASFTLVGLLGLRLEGVAFTLNKSALPLDATRLDVLGILAVLSLPVIGAWTALNRNTPTQVTLFRELVTLAIMLVMAFLVFAKQQQLRTELTEINQDLKEALMTDALTGTRNRRFFDATIFGDASQALRSYAAKEGCNANDIILYMMDLDNFKEINDRYGHYAGDQVLVGVTKRITAAIRASDVLIRWGGDEFLLVSRHSDRAEAASFASRILTVVGKPITITDAAVEILPTCSIGWAAFPWYPEDPKAVSLEAVLALADRGVIEAKTSGRNRAIGVSPCPAGTSFLVATAGDRVSTYSVQTSCVMGPLVRDTLVH